MSANDKQDRAFMAMCFLLMTGDDDKAKYRGPELLEQLAHAAYNAVEVFTKVTAERGAA